MVLPRTSAVSRAGAPSAPERHDPPDPREPPAAGRRAVDADAWADADVAAVLLALHPQGLGGVRLQGPADERRQHWLQCLRSHGTATTPWLRLPLHTDDERLLGGLDLGATLQRGTVVAQPGLLSRADGGFVLAAMAERMSPAMAARLSAVLDTGIVAAQRPGLTGVTAARVALVALDEAQREGQAADAAATEAPPAALLERLGLWLDLTPLPRPAETTASIDLPRLAAARKCLPAVSCTDELLQALCAAAVALGVPSLRVSLFGLAAAKAHAAWCGRLEVAVEDVAVAARLVLAPRATQLPLVPDDAVADATEAPGDDAAPAPGAAPPPAGGAENMPAPAQQPLEAEPQAQPNGQPTAPADSQRDPSASTSADQVLQSALAAVPAGLLQLLAAAAVRGPAAAGGRAGALQASRLRGRPYGSRRGDPRGGARLHLIDTLRAAAPWQLLRQREVAVQAATDAGIAAGAASILQPQVHVRAQVQVRREDFHVSRFRQRRETTTVFVVDASGSAALHRLAEAKGAVELLLAECYVRRDRVALLSFRGAVGAELLLPPTRSLVRAKRCLAGMPGGGGTPLAAALDAARDLTQDIARRGGTPLAVFLTDGRANIARDGSPGRARAHADALAAARAWRAAGLGAVWLDTAPHPQPQAQALAQTMGARYLPLPHADARQMSRAVMALR